MKRKGVRQRKKAYKRYRAGHSQREIEREHRIWKNQDKELIIISAI